MCGTVIAHFTHRQDSFHIAIGKLYSLSGGLGRSGTFLTIFYAVHMARQGTPLDADRGLFDAIWKMRTQRHPWMVEGLAQYALAHRVIVEILSKDK